MELNLFNESVLDDYKLKSIHFVSNYEKVIVDLENNYSKIVLVNRDNKNDVLGEFYVNSFRKKGFIDSGKCTTFFFRIFCEYVEKIHILKMSKADFEKSIKFGPLVNYSNVLAILTRIFGNLNPLVKSLLSVDKFNKVKLSGDVVNIEKDRLGMRYVWKMKIEYEGKQYTFKYTNSINNGNKMPLLKDCIYGLLCDRQAFLSCRDLEDFYRNFCSEDMTAGEVNRIYNACEKTSLSLERVFDSDLEWFEKALEDY